MPIANYGQAVSGMVAARKRKKSFGGVVKFAPTPTVPHPDRDAGGESKRVLLPGRKYNAAGKPVQDTHGARVTKRSGDLTNRVGAYADYQKKPRKQMVMKYLARNR